MPAKTSRHAVALGVILALELLLCLSALAGATGRYRSHQRHYSERLGVSQKATVVSSAATATATSTVTTTATSGTATTNAVPTTAPASAASQPQADSTPQGFPRGSAGGGAPRGGFHHGPPSAVLEARLYGLQVVDVSGSVTGDANATGVLHVAVVNTASDQSLFYSLRLFTSSPGLPVSAGIFSGLLNATGTLLFSFPAANWTNATDPSFPLPFPPNGTANASLPPLPLPPSNGTTTPGTSVKVTSTQSAPSSLFNTILNSLSSALSFLHLTSTSTTSSSSEGNKQAVAASDANSSASAPQAAPGPLPGGFPGGPGGFPGGQGGFPGGGPGDHPPPPGAFAYELHGQFLNISTITTHSGASLADALASLLASPSSFFALVTTPAHAKGVAGGQLANDTHLPVNGSGGFGPGGGFGPRGGRHGGRDDLLALLLPNGTKLPTGPPSAVVVAPLSGKSGGAANATGRVELRLFNTTAKKTIVYSVVLHLPSPSLPSSAAIYSGLANSSSLSSLILTLAPFSGTATWTNVTAIKPPCNFTLGQHHHPGNDSFGSPDFGNGTSGPPDFGNGTFGPPHDHDHGNGTFGPPDGNFTGGGFPGGFPDGPDGSNGTAPGPSAGGFGGPGGGPGGPGGRHGGPHDGPGGFGGGPGGLDLGRGGDSGGPGFDGPGGFGPPGGPEEGGYLYATAGIWEYAGSVTVPGGSQSYLEVFEAIAAAPDSYFAAVVTAENNDGAARGQFKAPPPRPAV